MMKRFLLAIFASAISAVAAFAQSNPGGGTGLQFGQVPTAAQWNSYFAAKTDYPPNLASFIGILGVPQGGTGAALTLSNGGIVYSTGGALAILPGTSTAALCLLSGSNAPPTWGSCVGGAAVASVSNSDGTLTFSPTTGSVVGSLALGHANTWTATQTFPSASLTGTELAANTVANSNIAQMVANTTKCNNTGATATPIDCTVSQEINMLSTGAWHDTSAVVGSLASFWTTSGAALVGFFNRSFVGEATKNNTGNDSSGPFSWIEGLIGGFVASSQLSVGNTVGSLALTGYSRASDSVTANSSHNNINAQGTTAFAYCDDTANTGSPAPICTGGNLIGAMKAGVTVGFAQGAQLDINNAASAGLLDPNSPTPNAGSVSLLLTSGAYPTLGTTNASGAISVGGGRVGGPVFNAGIVFGVNAIAVTSAGSLGNFARAIELGNGQAITWWGAGTTESAAFLVDGSGAMHMVVANMLINNVATQTKTCTVLPTVNNGIVTSC